MINSQSLIGFTFHAAGLCASNFIMNKNNNNQRNVWNDSSLKFLPMPVLTAKWLPHSNEVPSLNFLFVSDLRGLSVACWVNWWFQAECVYVRVCCCLSVIPPLDRRPNPGCTAPLTVLQLK